MIERPANAEHLDLGPFFEMVKGPSKLLPGLTQITPTIICPDCKAHHRSTCKPITCQCGLSMQMDIGALFIWKQEDA